MGWWRLRRGRAVGWWRASGGQASAGQEEGRWRASDRKFAGKWRAGGKQKATKWRAGGPMIGAGGWGGRGLGGEAGGGEDTDGLRIGRVGVVEGRPWEPAEAQYPRTLSQQRNCSRQRHVGHARCSEATAIWLSQRSTFLV